MTSKIIGRKACPWCGFLGAHVRQKDAKHPYHYCPECGLTTAARNGAQAAHITKGMRPADGGEPPAPPPTSTPIVVKGGAKSTAPAPATEAPAPVAPARPASWADQLLKGLG